MIRTAHPPETFPVNTLLGLRLAGVTSAASAAAAEWIGRGDKDSADKSAVTAMDEALERSHIPCVVTIGEGEKDEAPMLAHGHIYGEGKPLFDLTADPIEGTTRLSKGRPGSMSVLALAERGTFPEWDGISYMNKLFVSPEASELMDNGDIGLHKNPAHNIRLIAKALKKPISELNVAVLNREKRNRDILKAARWLGVHLMPLDSGDLFPAMQACEPARNRRVDVLYGSGGAPEGVLAAAYVAIAGGNGQLMWHPQTDQEVATAHELELNGKPLSLGEAVGKGPLYFAATGITDSPKHKPNERPMLKGAQNFEGDWYPGTSIMVYRPGRSAQNGKH
jgi:fructose-1,6-bisphosphatase II